MLTAKSEHLDVIVDIFSKFHVYLRKTELLNNGIENTRDISIYTYLQANLSRKTKSFLQNAEQVSI